LPLEYACYDAQGNLIAQSRRAALDPAFGVPNLARQVLRGGSSSDQIGSVSDQSAMLRVAVIAQSPVDGSTLGVVQVGAPIAGYLIALRTLSIVLILVGAFTLLVSALGGFVLSARSLLPARLAYGRQQRFIADVSHELRTPLTLLRADAEVLLRGSERLPEEDVEILENIVAETAHLANLTSSLLTMARLDSGTLHAERDVVDITEVVENVASRARAFAEQRSITVRVETSPDVIVLGTLELLEQAAMILVDNAIKYNTRGGSVTVRSERKGGTAYVTIQDTGIGIATEHLPHLGERFYRPDKARSRQEGGAGLGLSIARRIAEMHGGALTLESTPGQGTMATITLPALEARARAEATP
jgi:signal transduction histidine kinase